MKNFIEFAKRLAEAFENAGLDYAFTGALAVSFYGLPRTTTDVDVMVTADTRIHYGIKAKLFRGGGARFPQPRMVEAVGVR